jgi:hypothetical protein
MKAHGVACCDGRARQRWARGAAGGAIFAVLAALMPKCPLCIAAWLGVLGLSGLAARVDPRVLWLATAMAVAVAGASLVHRFSRRKETRP